MYSLGFLNQPYSIRILANSRRTGLRSVQRSGLWIAGAYTLPPNGGCGISVALCVHLRIVSVQAVPWTCT